MQQDACRELVIQVDFCLAPIGFEPVSALEAFDTDLSIVICFQGQMGFPVFMYEFLQGVIGGLFGIVFAHEPSMKSQVVMASTRGWLNSVVYISVISRA